MNRMIKFIIVVLFTLCFFKSEAQVGVPVMVPYGYVSWVQLPDGYDSTKKYPVLMVCHGVGEKAPTGGDDSTYAAGGYLNIIYNNSNYPSYFRERGWSGKGYDVITGDSISFVIVSPQATPATGGGWFWSGAVGSVLNKISTLYSIDTNRVYITGLSGGARPTIAYAAGVHYDGGTVSNKKYIPAAIVPMSAAGEVNSRLQAGLLASRDIPIWQFTGTTDDNYTNINNFHGYVLDSGGVSRITNYSGGHCCWGTYYNPTYKEKIGSDSMNIYTWLLQYKRDTVASKSIYISESDGDDSRTLAQAQNPSTPWKTITKLNAEWDNIYPNDTVKFKKGDTLYGQINVNTSGALGSPVVITSYGSGSTPPVITGLTRLTSWTNHSGYIYKAECTTCPNDLNMMIMDKVPQQKGRTPNAGYLKYESNTIFSITDNELSGSPDWTGAQVVIRKANWLLDVHKILSHVGTTLYIDSVNAYSPQPNYGYFIQHDIRTLDSLGEWYFDSTSKYLYVFFSTDPSNYDVRVPTIDTLVRANLYKNNITFKDLKFEGAGKAIMSWRFNPRITIDNCVLNYAGLIGIQVVTTGGEESNHFWLKNSIVKNSMSKGIDIGRSAADAVIEKNLIDSCGYYQGHSTGRQMDQYDGRMGIISYSTRTNIRDNEVSNIGFMGILVKADTNIIERNKIHDYAFIKNDAGAIYTSMASYPYAKLGIVIRNNIIYNGRMAFDGTPNNSAWPQTTGVYLDDSTSNVLVEDNVMYNIRGTGFFNHNNRDVTFRDNKVYGCDWGWEVHYDGSSLPHDMGMVTKNNQLFSDSIGGRWAFTVATGADEYEFGDVDSNYYVKNHASTDMFTMRRSPGVTTTKTFSEWQSYGLDAHATTLQKSTSLFVGDSTGYKTLTGTWQDVKGNVYSGVVSLQPYQALMLYPFEGVLPVTIKQFFIYRKKIKFQ